MKNPIFPSAKTKSMTIYGLLFMLACVWGCQKPIVLPEPQAAPSCTVTYTNSAGVTFTATATYCSDAYEEIKPFIEAQ